MTDAGSQIRDAAEHAGAGEGGQRCRPGIAAGEMQEIRRIDRCRFERDQGLSRAGRRRLGNLDQLGDLRRQAET